MTRVFISYRREDSAGHAGRIFDRMAAEFDADHVFMDVDSIGPGVDFAERVQQAVLACDATIVVIGPAWHGPSGETQRLDDPADMVRIEVETALNAGRPVIPVLVNNAVMPATGDLPATLSALTRRNAVELSNARWKYDIGRLVDAVSATSEKKRGDNRRLIAAGVGVAAIVAAGALLLGGGAGSGIDYKTVSAPKLALSVAVPKGWHVAQRGYLGLNGNDSRLGQGILATAGINRTTSPTSFDFTQARIMLAVARPAAVRASAVKAFDVLKDAQKNLFHNWSSVCRVLDGYRQEPKRPDYQIYVKEMSGCGPAHNATLWEAVAVPRPFGQVVAILQIVGTPGEHGTAPGLMALKTFEIDLSGDFGGGASTPAKKSATASVAHGIPQLPTGPTGSAAPVMEDKVPAVPIPTGPTGSSNPAVTSRYGAELQRVPSLEDKDIQEPASTGPAPATQTDSTTGG